MTLLSGITLTIIVSFITANLIGIRVVHSEIIARINPNLGDLVVGLAAGAAASFAYTRRSISTALPGVAISVALVPPLSVVGIGLFVREQVTPAVGISLGGSILWDGALLLFLTNLVAIVFAASLVLLLQAYGYWRRAILGLLLSLIALLLISFPLGFSFEEVILRAQVRNQIAVVAHQEFSHLIDRGASLRSINVETGEDGALNVELFIFAPRDSIFQHHVNRVQEFFSEKIQRPVNLKLRVIPFDILEFEVLEPERRQPN